MSDEQQMDLALQMSMDTQSPEEREARDITMDASNVELPSSASVSDASSTVRNTDSTSAATQVCSEFL